MTKTSAVFMQTAQILLEIIHAFAMMVILEMGFHAQVIPIINDLKIIKGKVLFI